MFEEPLSGASLSEPPNEKTSTVLTPTPYPHPVPGHSHAEDLAYLEQVRQSMALLDLSGDAKAQHETLGALEYIKSAAVGAQVFSATLFEADVVARRLDTGTREKNPSYGVGPQVALARRESPDQGRSFLSTAHRLVSDMQYTLAALLQGEISWGQVVIIVKNTNSLPAAQCADIDQQLLATPTGLKGLCPRALEDKVRHLTYTLDSSDALTRMEDAQAHRYFSVFPARDGMMQVSGMFSVADGLAIQQTLKQEAARLKAAGDLRTLAQIMADVATERITGRTPTEGIEIQLVLSMSDRTLFQGSSEPAYLQGYGTVPSTWARMMVGGRDPQDRTRYRAQVSLKRIYTHPGTGALLGMDAHSRQFPKNLKDLIRIRDQYCRTPYCNAPIKHFDHVVQHSRGGETSASNGVGRCASCNQTKEQGGWIEEVIDSGGRHTIKITTPTGAQYTSTAPPLPGTPH